jgi:hypothetical protein
MTDSHTRRNVLALAGSMATLAGCAGTSVPTEEKPSPSETVNAWLDDHQPTEQEAVDQYTMGNDAFEASDYSRALMHYERARNKFLTLEEAIDSKIQNYQNGTRVWELFSKLGQYYSFIRRASTWRHSAAYERAVNDDPVASEKALATSDDRFERAEELKQEFRDMMDN